jgi:hypothetical protein
MKEPLPERPIKERRKEEQMSTARKSGVGVVRGAAEWKRLVDEFSVSGETLGAFSARHGFSTGALEYWRRKFRDTGEQRKRMHSLNEYPHSSTSKSLSLTMT